jgi:hypothetical protein
VTTGSDASGRVPETAPPAGVSSSRRRIAILLAASLLLAALGAGGWQLLRPATSPDQYATATPTDVGAVMVVLQRHAAALLGRNSVLWSADLDQSNAAALFTQHQKDVFDNLGGVPLTTWRYALAAPVTDPAVLDPAATRLGTQVVVLHIRLEYALALVDPQPTAKDLWLTAVHRRQGWRLAGDSDVSGAGGQSWLGPWDFGPLRVRTGPHTLVLAHPDHAADLSTFGELVEASAPVVTSVWGTAWNDHVAVLIPDTPAEFASVASESGDSHDLAAVAVADQVTSSGSVLGARIVLNPTNLAELDPVGRRLVVQHELTHIAARADTSDQMPTWLIEGFADYVGNLGSGQQVRTTAAELAAEIRRGVVPAALPTAADFGGANSRLQQVYEESWLACRLIARRAGQQGLVRFYKTVSAAANIDPNTAVALGLDKVLHTDVAAFTATWRSDLRAQLD